MTSYQPELMEIKRSISRGLGVPPAKEYTSACSTLLVQYKAAFKLVKSTDVPDVETFVKRYRLNCAAAMERIAEARPITIRDDKGNTSRCIADIVSMFITLMDKLKLDIKSVDELVPDVRDLRDTMERMSALPDDFEPKKKVSFWLDTLGTMRAADELTEDQSRQMVFDLEAAYNGFNKFLHESG